MTPREAIRALEIGDFASYDDRSSALALFDCLAQWAEESGWEPDPEQFAARKAERDNEQSGD